MKKISINKAWMLYKGTVDLAAEFSDAGNAGKMIDLPHDAMIDAGRSADSITGSGGGYFNPNDYTYVKSLFVPEADEGKIICLEFEGIYMNAFVEINGEFVGKQPNGYTDFILPIQDYLHFGRENQIKVLVKNSSQPNGRWYTGAGIYRDVWLLSAPQLHILPDGIRVSTINADSIVAALDVETDIANEGIGHKKGRLNIRIKDVSGQIAVQSSTAFHIGTNETMTLRQHLFIKKPMLWNIDTPNLYSCECEIMDGEDILDCASTDFGIRTLQLDNVYGLRINGTPTKLRGGCIHHDNGVLGTATFADAEERRIRLLKEVGYNAIRSSHNPMSRALLNACDKYGMLVMDEYTDCWTHTKNTFDYAFSMTEWWEKDLESMVRKDYNHPCVVMYSIGNEIPDVGKELSASWGRKFAEKIRSLDHTRFVTNAINVLLANMDMIGALAQSAAGREAAGGEINTVMTTMSDVMEMMAVHPMASAAIEESCELLDIIGYNYSAGRYELDHQLNSNRIVMGSETCPSHLDRNWDLVKKHGYVLGDFSWTAWDYLGETGIGRCEAGPAQQELAASYPWIVACCGDLDITGYRRPVSYWRETVWNGRRHEPYISVQNPANIGKEMYMSIWSWTDSLHSWTWPGCEGMQTVVEVYSDAEEAEIFLNGKSFGRKPVGNEFRNYYCKWDLFYETGTLEAVSYINGEEVGRSELKTAGQSYLKLEKDRISLKCNSDELCYILIEKKDENGTLDMTANDSVTLSVEGPAVLQGCGSADPKTVESYSDTCHTLYQGRMLAVLRAGQKKGRVKFAVSTEKESSSVELEIL